MKFKEDKFDEYFRVGSLEALKDFPSSPHPLAIVERRVPDGAQTFFQKLLVRPFRISGEVHAQTSLQDILCILERSFPEEIRKDPFHEYWANDMAQACRIFCFLEKSDTIVFRLGSQRECRRYHIDNVPQRMLVTYAGKGTEWIPDEAADRYAYANGEPNEKILIDPTAPQFVAQWDAAVFRGGPKGLLHRTPDAALKSPSLLMRLDHPSFWTNSLAHH